MKYPDLFAEFKKLQHRFLTLCDLLDHEEGLLPSLQVDKDLQEQRQLEYLQNLKLNIKRSAEGDVRWSERVDILIWWEEQLKRNPYWIFNDAELDKLHRHLQKRIPIEKLGRACAEMNMNLH